MLRFLTLVTILSVIVLIGVISGLYIPRLVAQEEPPQRGYGSLQRMEMITIDKCSADFILYRNANDIIEASISIPAGLCNTFTEDQIAQQTEDALQAFSDKCEPRSGLDSDDPDKTTDPKDPQIFWSTVKGTPSLCSRTVDIGVEWSTEVSEYIISWSSVR